MRLLGTPEGGGFQAEERKGKGPAMAPSLECLRDSQSASMAGAGESKGRVAGNESGGVGGR